MEAWIGDAEAVVADITFVNDNVTYEVGYAIGAQKDLRLIYNSSVDNKRLKEIALFDTLIHDNFKTRVDLEKILRDRAAPKNKWPPAPRNPKQPIYVLTPSTPSPLTTRLLSAIKKQTRYKFRSFSAWEIGRLTAQDAWDQVSASFGVVATWQDGGDLDARRNNQRAMLIIGMGRALRIPTLLLAHEQSSLPADIAAQAMIFFDINQFDRFLFDFRDEVQDALIEFPDAVESPPALLSAIHCGDGQAENEQESLKLYFLETEEFRRTMGKSINVLIGRKGSGKTAIFLQVRDRFRAERINVVIDLNPEGYQLLKLKEVITNVKSLGVRKEFIAAFWQYVLWLEVAYKLLEKDKNASRRDSVLAERYSKLETLFRTRVDTGAGDFSERLTLLTDMIADRFEKRDSKDEIFKSSDVLRIIYGEEISAVRDQVFSYLKLKGTLLLLFDNLDRMRTPAGFDSEDAAIVLGLIEAMQEIAKSFRKHKLDCSWVVFLRSDVYVFVLEVMADYSKHQPQLLEWTDRGLLKTVLQKRIMASLSDRVLAWDETWREVSTPSVRGKDTLDFLVDASLMRPRYLIRLFESAKRRAVSMGRARILEEDYEASLVEIGWTMVDDLDNELSDVLRNTRQLVFDLGHLNGACGLDELRDVIANRVGATSVVERVIDVLLWSGTIGIKPGASPITFIYNCGYKLAHLQSLMRTDPDVEVCLHPTLANLRANSVL